MVMSLPAAAQQDRLSWEGLTDSSRINRKSSHSGPDNRRGRTKLTQWYRHGNRATVCRVGGAHDVRTLRGRANGRSQTCLSLTRLHLHT